MNVAASKGWLDKLTSKIYRFMNGEQQVAKGQSLILDIRPEAIYLQEEQTIQFDPGSDTSDNFTIVKKIGQGGFGSIFKVSQSNHFYALKVLDLWKQQPNEWESLVGRFNGSFHAGQLASPYLVKYYHKGTLRGNPCILMELCENGNLEERRTEFKQESAFTKLGIQILSGLLELHANGKIIHRDIKPKNILFGVADTPKLTDFDFSAFLNKRKTIKSRRGHVKEVWYTRIYAPPEQTDPKVAFEKAQPPMDMFAFGVTMYELITQGQFPWGPAIDSDQDHDAYFEKVSKGMFTPIEHYRSDISDRWAKAINQCLLPNPQERVQGPAHFFQLVGFDGNWTELAQEETEKVDEWVLTMKSEVYNLEKKVNLNQLRAQLQKDHLHIGREINTQQLLIEELPDSDGVHYVSRRHATLKFENKKWFIRDGQPITDAEWPESTNGTVISNAYKGTDQFLTNDVFIELNHGDIIRLADKVNMKLKHI